MLKPKETKKSKSSSSPCDTKRILQAISILKQLNQKFTENKEKKSLLDDESENPIFLQLTMKKIPPPTMQKFVKVDLPKSTLSDKSEVCLITGDLDKRNVKAEVEPDVLHFKELLKKENISQVNEVITLRQLRKEYKPFEARRQLCGAYDVFLCDKKIAGVLPRTLGKSFFKKRKLPIQINMQSQKLKEQIESALSSTVFHITCKGNSCASQVANVSMEEKDILSNIVSSIDVLKEQLPGQWNNVLGIYVKTPKSKAIPLYMSNDDPNEFNFTKKRVRTKSVTAELSTFANSEVRVFRDGRVVVKKPKKKVESPKTSECVEENGSEDKINPSELKIEELSSFPATEGEVVSDNTDIAKKLEKKKRNSSLISNEESSQVEVETEAAVEPEKKRKTRKSNVKFQEETSQVEVETEEVVEPEKKRNKRKSNLNFHEETSQGEVEAKEVVEPEKKRNKRKSNLNFHEETSKVEVETEEVVEPEKKRNKRKSNLNFHEETSHVEVETKEVVEPEKKRNKRKSNLNFHEETSQVEVETEEVVKPEKKRNKRKSNLNFHEETSEVEVIDEKLQKSPVNSGKNKDKKKKNQS